MDPAQIPTVLLERIRKALPKSADGDFKVIVTDVPDSAISTTVFERRRWPKPLYYTIAVMRQVEIKDKDGNNIAGIIEKTKILGEDLTDEEKGKYNNWYEAQIQQRLEEYEGESAEVRAAVEAEERFKGPLYHNILKLRVIPNVFKEKLTGVVLDSWFYYTLVDISRGVKKLGDLDQLFKEIQAFAYNDLSADFMALYDGWVGFNRASLTPMDSGDLRVAAKGPQTNATPRRGYTISRFLQESPFDRPRSSVVAAVGEAGYYGRFGFMTFKALQDIDSGFAKTNTVRCVELLCIFGSPTEFEFDTSKIMFQIRPIRICIQTTTGQHYLDKVALDSSPSKVLGVQGPVFKDKADVPGTFYGLMRRGDRIQKMLIGGSDIFTITMNDTGAIPFGISKGSTASGDGTRSVRRKTSRAADVSGATAAFTDIAV